MVLKVVGLGAMRLGCSGCLVALGVLSIAVGAAAVAAWMAAGMLQPTALIAPPTTEADGLTAQQKIYDLTRRGGRLARRQPVVLTEAELNAFLSRHLAEAADLPVTGVALRLPADGFVDLAGRLPLGTLLSELPGPGVSRLLSAHWTERPVWVRIRGQARLDPGTGGRRYLRVDVDQFWLGRRRLPAVLVRLLFSPVALRLLRLPIPDTVESLSVHQEHLVIRVAS